MSCCLRKNAFHTHMASGEEDKGFELLKLMKWKMGDEEEAICK